MSELVKVTLTGEVKSATNARKGLACIIAGGKNPANNIIITLQGRCSEFCDGVSEGMRLEINVTPKKE